MEKLVIILATFSVLPICSFLVRPPPYIAKTVTYQVRGAARVSANRIDLLSHSGRRQHYIRGRQSRLHMSDKGGQSAVLDIESVAKELLAVADVAVQEMEAATTPQELEDLRRKYLTKKGPVQQVLGQMKSLSNADKPKLGKVGNEVKATLEAKLASCKQALEEGGMDLEFAADAVDVTMPGLNTWEDNERGHRHPLSIVEELAVEIFVNMGYDLVDGTFLSPEIENDYYCFEALNCPKDHPARDMQDTFYLDYETDSGETLMLRTHTSAVQIRTLELRGPPLAIVAPGRVYRKDDIDATHSPEFHQIEILNIQKKGELNLESLKGTVEEFLQKIFGPDIKCRFRSSYFPFTEPSMEVDIWFKNRWMEVLGCGMVDPRVLEMAGVDPNEYVGFAAGFGVERFTMVLFGIPDLRYFWDGDLRFIEQFPSDTETLLRQVREGTLQAAVPREEEDYGDYEDLYGDDDDDDIEDELIISGSVAVDGE